MYDRRETLEDKGTRVTTEDMLRGALQNTLAVRRIARHWPTLAGSYRAVYGADGAVVRVRKR